MCLNKTTKAFMFLKYVLFTVFTLPNLAVLAFHVLIFSLKALCAYFGTEKVFSAYGPCAYKKIECIFYRLPALRGFW